MREEVGFANYGRLTATGIYAVYLGSAQSQQRSVKLTAKGTFTATRGGSTTVTQAFALKR